MLFLIFLRLLSLINKQQIQHDLRMIIHLDHVDIFFLKFLLFIKFPEMVTTSTSLFNCEQANDNNQLKFH